VSDSDGGRRTGSLPVSRDSDSEVLFKLGSDSGRYGTSGCWQAEGWESMGQLRAASQAGSAAAATGFRSAAVGARAAPRLRLGHAQGPALEILDCVALLYMQADRSHKAEVSDGIHCTQFFYINHHRRRSAVVCLYTRRSAVFILNCVMLIDSPFVS
jgi:hypothetical protein